MNLDQATDVSAARIDIQLYALPLIPGVDQSVSVGQPPVASGLGLRAIALDVQSIRDCSDGLHRAMPPLAGREPLLVPLWQALGDIQGQRRSTSRACGPCSHHGPELASFASLALSRLKSPPFVLRSHALPSTSEVRGQSARCLDS